MTAEHGEAAEAAREVFEAFLGGRVFCQSTEESAPGVLALGRPGDGVIPVFSSLEELGRFRAARDEADEGVSWFATSGADLINLIPDGYAILLDPGTDHATLLHHPRD